MFFQGFQIKTKNCSLLLCYCLQGLSIVINVSNYKLVEMFMPPPVLSLPVHVAQWAHMQHYLSVCLFVHHLTKIQTG